MPRAGEATDFERELLELTRAALKQARINNRLTAMLLKATTTQQELVRVLAGSGASNQEIADVLDTTPATIANALQRLKKRTEKKGDQREADRPELTVPNDITLEP